MRAIFQKKGKKGQKRAKYLKIWGKCTKFENILKKGSLVRATMARMKQLAYALLISWYPVLILRTYVNRNVKTYLRMLVYLILKKLVILSLQWFFLH